MALTRDCGMFFDQDPSESSFHVREYNVKPRVTLKEVTRASSHDRECRDCLAMTTVFRGSGCSVRCVEVVVTRRGRGLMIEPRPGNSGLGVAVSIFQLCGFGGARDDRPGVEGYCRGPG